MTNQRSPSDGADSGLDATDYPALFLSADQAARRGQKNLVLLSVADIGFTLIAATIALVASGIPAATTATRPTPLDIAFAATAISFLFSVTFKLIGISSGFEADWFNGRAVAEAVKSMTWRYMMRTPPYAAGDVDTRFTTDVTRLARAHTDLRQELRRMPRLALQITAQMRSTRALEMADRRSRYMDGRLLAQTEWYRTRSIASQRTANIWFWGSIVLQLAAAGVAIVAVIFGGQSTHGADLLKLTALLASISLAGVAWTELRRHGELSRSYAVTFQELASIASLADRVDAEDKLATLVGQSERAMIREHELWLARRTTPLDLPDADAAPAEPER